jgi:hypothetical protein
MSGDVKLLLLDEPFEGLAAAVVLELFNVTCCAGIPPSSSSSTIRTWCWRWPTASLRWSAARHFIGVSHSRFSLI